MPHSKIYPISTHRTRQVLRDIAHLRHLESIESDIVPTSISLRVPAALVREVNDVRRRYQEQGKTVDFSTILLSGAALLSQALLFPDDLQIVSKDSLETVSPCHVDPSLIALGTF